MRLYVYPGPCSLYRIVYTSSILHARIYCASALFNRPIRFCFSLNMDYRSSGNIYSSTGGNKWCIVVTHRVQYTNRAIKLHEMCLQSSSLAKIHLIPSLSVGCAITLQQPTRLGGSFFRTSGLTSPANTAGDINDTGDSK